MKKINKVQKVIGFMMLLLIISMVVYVVLILLPNKKTNMSPDDTIKFGYTSYKRDTKLYKDTFDSLGKVLDKEPIDYEEYAKYLSELFIIDFYTLDNKNDKNDIGGIQFIYDDLKDNFILNASDTVYKYIKNITSSKNRQLPVVSKINVSDISVTSRAAMGVTLMRTNEEEKVVAITKISADVDKEKKDNTTKNNEKEVQKNDFSLDKLVERAMSEIEDTNSEE